MKSKIVGIAGFLLSCLLLLAWLPFRQQNDALQPLPQPGKPRLFVLTDVSNEPDDEQSLVRLLVYANEFNIEGLVATTSTWLRENPREDLIRRHVAAYAKVRPNLQIHADGFPTADSLLAVIKTGQTRYGMKAVGSGKNSAGSKQLIQAVDRAANEPVWVAIWGGANTLAQALRDVRATRTSSRVDEFVAKLRVYAISDQDDAGPWIRREFPKLFYIVSPSSPESHLEYYRSTWSGISGDKLWGIGVGHCFDMVDNPWLKQHIRENHGPLGERYPPVKYLMEGDTPSFLGLIDNGLGWATRPDYGGWGGRYVLYQSSSESRPIWTSNADSRDTVVAENGQTETSNHATIWRWREHFQNDFAARMDWCVTDSFEKANHNPHPVLNGDRTKDVIRISAKHGEILKLSAEGSDPGDAGQQVKLNWWIYQESGNLKGASLSHPSGETTEVSLPEETGSLHVILQAEDNGTPRLFAYRRVVIEVSPSMANRE